MARSSDSGFLLSLLRDKSFQASEIRRVIALSVVYLLITTALVGIFYHQLLGKLIEGMAPLLFVSEDAVLTSDVLPGLREVIGRWMLAMLLINVAITVGVSLFIVRRLGAPILAIKRTLREIGAGNLDVRLRASDSRDFGEIAAELTAAMRMIREQIATAKEGMNGAGKFDDQHQDVPIDLQQAINECRTALDYFQVDASDDPIDDARVA